MDCRHVSCILNIALMICRLTQYSPLNCIGMPYYREKLASAWPETISDVGAPPVKFDPQFLAGLKAAEFGFYGRNTTGLRRNQVEDTRSSNKFANSGLKAPKFLSEKARESAKSDSTSAGEKADELSNPFSEMEIESRKSEFPMMYRNVEIKYSKFGIDDFDFGYVNENAFAFRPGANKSAFIMRHDTLASRLTYRIRTPIRFSKL
jgi:PAB-dependent poly(A)-specific ribonuclease subunit 2